MKQYIQNNIRIQFLSQDVVRLEVGKKGVFCDKDTLLVANKSAFDGVDVNVVTKSDGTYVECGDVMVFVPTDAKSLVGVKVFVGGKIAYVYKFLRNSGELPSLDKTPEVFPVADNPRVVLPDGGYRPNGQNNNGYVIDDNACDVYLLVCRGNAAKLRRLYVELTGRPELVRLATLGSWNSRYYKYNQQQAEQMILDYEAHDIPLDNIVIDTDWRKASDRGIGYEVDEVLFPNMSGYFRFAHEHGVDVMFNDHPEPQQGCTSCIDPKEVEYRVMHLAEHLENGLDTWWYDRNWHTKLVSPVKGIAPETWGMHIFSDVTRYVRQRQAKNDVIYRRADIMANVDNINNGLYVGIGNSASHRYSIQWTGDIGTSDQDILEEVTDMIRCGDNCLPYVHPDCGGNNGNPDKDTYLRWMKFGALSTVLRPHCTICVKRFREPWAYDDKAVEDIVRDYINLRYRLLPLLYTEAYKSYRDGSPICRGLGWNYPDDKKALACKTQYMIGANLLVAPVFGGALNNVPQSFYATPVDVTYYNGRELKGEPIAKARYAAVNMYCNHTSPESGVPVYDYSARWETTLCPKKDIALIVEADDGVRVWIDGKLCFDDWACHAAIKSDVCKLTANTMYKVRIEYFQGGGEAACALHYTEQSDGDNKPVYLPEGRWMNLFTGKTYDGKKTIRVKVDDVKQLPVFVRMGGVIFTARNARNTKVQKWDKLTVDVFPSKNASDSGFVYEDDRNTTAYKVGEYRTTEYALGYDDKQNKIVLTLGASKGEFKGKYACKSRKIKVKYHLLGDCADVKEVLVNGAPVKAMLRSRKKSEFPLSDSNHAADSRLLTLEFVADVNDEQTVEFVLNK